MTLPPTARSCCGGLNRTTACCPTCTTACCPWRPVQPLPRRFNSGAFEELGPGGEVFVANAPLTQAELAEKHALIKPRGDPSAPSHCHVVLPLIHLIPDPVAYSVPLFLKRQCDRTLGDPSAPSRFAKGRDAGHALQAEAELARALEQHGFEPAQARRFAGGKGRLIQ